MLVPAATLQRELEHRFSIFQYSDELMLYNGCIQNYPWQFKEQDGHYQYAIVTSELHLVGYVSYNVDFYSHQVYGFGLICFDENPKYKMIMATAIRQIINQIQYMRPHRIEFRYVSDNKAAKGYQKIVERMCGPYHEINEFRFTGYMRDRHGVYHDLSICEIIDPYYDLRSVP